MTVCRAQLETVDGRPQQAIALLTAAADRAPGEPELAVWSTEVAVQALLWLGNSDEAHRRATDLLATLQGTPVTARVGRLLALTARAKADQLGTSAGVTVEELQDLARRSGCFDRHSARVLAQPWGLTFRAELARLASDDDADAWRLARDAWQAPDAPHAAAYAGWRLAERLLRNRHSKAGETALRNAAAAAEQHRPLTEAIEALAGRARVALEPAASPGVDRDPLPAAAAVYGLTPRELAVLRSLGTGMTNPEIGRMLYISSRTVSVHVTSILRKLGVRGRVQAATAAESLGLLQAGQADHPE